MAVGASRSRSPFRFPLSPFARQGFTLTELLVVITIIAILAGLVTAAAVNALNKGKQTAITLELQQLSGAMEDFKNDNNAYPPNGTSPAGMTDNAGTLIRDIHVSDFGRMFRKAFPRHQEPDTLIAGLAGGGSGTSPTALEEGMNGAEAVYFWLGGFSEDVTRPLSGPGGPSFVPADEAEDIEGRNRLFEFDLGRLGPRESDGTFDTDEDGDGGQGRFITYEFPVGSGTIRRINMWHYSPSNSQQPYGYFDASRHRAQIEQPPGSFVLDYDPWFGQTSPTTYLYALKRLNESNPNRAEFVNQGKFQLVHAGIDDAWGDWSVFSLLSGSTILFPEGPFIGDIADTVGNFMTGTLEDAQE